jgi:hypothetical protein
MIHRPGLPSWFNTRLRGSESNGAVADGEQYRTIAFRRANLYAPQMRACDHGRAQVSE